MQRRNEIIVLLPVFIIPPKRGFNNIFAKPLEIVNLSTLDQFQDGDTVTVHALLEKGILSKCRYGYKVLGSGKLSKKLTVCLLYTSRCV